MKKAADKTRTPERKTGKSGESGLNDSIHLGHERKPEPAEKPVSLRPLKFEDAVKALVTTPTKKPKAGSDT